MIVNAKDRFLSKFAKTLLSAQKAGEKPEVIEQRMAHLSANEKRVVRLKKIRLGILKR